MTAFPLRDVNVTKKNVLSLLVVPSSLVVDALTFGRFITTVTTTLAVVELSPLMQWFPFSIRYLCLTVFPLFKPNNLPSGSLPLTVLLGALCSVQ